MPTGENTASDISPIDRNSGAFLAQLLYGRRKVFPTDGALCLCQVHQ